MMERMTNKCDADAQREECARRLANGYPRNIPEERFLRLAAYEDTGLEPREVSAIVKERSDLCTVIGECGGLDRLRELAEADKEGRVVVLPCKVGDGLWTFCSHPVEQVYSFTVTSISTLNGRTMLNTSRCGVIDARDVGKTVFLTHKEAEKALEAMKDG